MEQPGTLGRYQLLRVLGRGAMGVVYEGIDPKLNRQVAVKTILKSQLVDPGLAAEYTARFMREAQAVARLNHPNIVQVFDFGNEAEVTYLVMEFIRGKELKGLLEEKRLLGIDEVVRIVSDLLQALDYAHEHGVIHRDIKPANVMIDGAGRVKLTDFGVARLSDAGSSEATKAGTMVGTPGYMAPEQIKGLSVGPQADIFATGVLLYQCLTLQKPFTGSSDWDVYHKIVNEDPPPLSQFRGGIPPALEAVVRRSLAKEPRDRYPSAGAMADELQKSVSNKTFDDEATRLFYDARAVAPTPDRTQAASSTTVASQSATRVGTSEAERDFWGSIKDSGDVEELREFLVQFPESIFANLAKIRINKLTGQGTGLESSALRMGRGESDLMELEKTQRRAQEEARIKAEEEAKRQVELERQRRAQKEAQRQVEEEARRRAEQEARRKAEADAAKLSEAEQVRRREREEAQRQEEARQRAEEENRRLLAERSRKAEQEKQAELEAKRRAEEAERQRAALEAERRAQEEAKRRATEEARRRAEEEAKRKADLETQRRNQEAARLRAEEDARRKAEEARKAELHQEDAADNDRTVMLGRSRPLTPPAAARPVELPIAADLPDSVLSPISAEPLAATKPAKSAKTDDSDDHPQFSTLDLPGKKSKLPLIVGGVVVALIAAGSLMFMGGNKDHPAETTKPQETAPQIPPPPPPAPTPAAEDPALKQKLAQEAAKKSEEQAAAAEKAAQEARREADARSQAVAEQSKAEAKARADEARKADDARKAEEARKKAEARKAEEAQQQAEARKADEAKKRDEARKAEEARRKDEARKKEEARAAFESSPEGILQLARKARKARKASEAIKLYAEAYNKGSGQAAKELADFYQAAGPNHDPDAAGLWYNRARQKGVNTGN
jgi:serine/threonine protein kinase